MDKNERIKNRVKDKKNMNEATKSCVVFFSKIELPFSYVYVFTIPSCLPAGYY